MKLIKLFALSLFFGQTIKAQDVDQRTLKPSQELLVKYSGDYIPSDKDHNVLIPMSIVLNDGFLYRRLENDMDRKLIPLNNKNFVYADGSGRKMEFVFDTKGNVIHVILSRPDGVYLLKKTK